MSTIKLNLEQAQDGICKCLEASRRAFNGAELLGKKHFYELAISLYILSAEERGKAVLVYRTILFDDEDETSWGKFWYNFRMHPTKLLAGSWHWTRHFFNLCWDTQFGRSIVETQGEQQAWLNFTKKKGFYTFFNKKEKRFHIFKVGLFEHEVIKMSRVHLEEMEALQTAGFFLKDNLEVLRRAFIQGKGKELFEKYKDVKKFNTFPELKKEYNDFIESSGLAKLNHLQCVASREVWKKPIIRDNGIRRKLLRFVYNAVLWVIGKRLSTTIEKYRNDLWSGRKEDRVDSKDLI